MLFTMPSWKQVNPPYKYKWTEKTVPVSEGSSETTTEGYMENYKNVSQEIRDQLNAKAEFLTSINNQNGKRFDDTGLSRSQDKEIDKLMALISLSFKKIYKPTNNNLRTSSNTSRANQDNTPRINRGTGYDNQRVVNVAGARENKPKWAKDVAYHKEKMLLRKQMLLCKQEEAGFQLNAEQADWRDDTDDEPEDQELEAHYMYKAHIQEVTPDAANNSRPIFDVEPLQKVQNNDDNYNVFSIESEHPEQHKSVNDTYPVEQDEHNIIIDSLDMSYDRKQDDQDDNDNLAKERDLIASLIAKLKCEIDDNKNRNKFLETSNKALVDKLKGEIEDFKTKNKSLESSNNYFKEANNELSKINQLMFKDLKKFQAELDREYYYADHMNVILGVYTTLNEFTNLQCDYVDQVVKCERLEKELSKSKTMSKSFEALQKHAINLELALQQLSELKKLIEKMKGKSVETKFEKSSVIRQPNAFKSQRQSILGKPATFSDSLAKTDFQVKSTNVIALGMYKVHTKPNQTRTPQLPQDIRKTNKLASFSTGVIPTTSVSRPQVKSNQLEDRVMPNNSQGKMQEVEDHRRNVKFSNNKKSVTACNDSLNATTSNVNFICVTCGKCMLNDNHDMCVLHYINGVNYRTKMPMAVPISTREPKRTVNQYAATTLKGTVAAESTNQKSRSTIRKQYEHISKTCKWWYFVIVYDADLKFAFRSLHVRFRDLKGNDPTHATSSQAWLWHRRLSHLNFDTINLPLKNNIVIGDVY
ncbi:hypothetical protein Tco_0226619 [Tanacetum coccineum]